MRVGVDTGGTFTDVVLADGTICKVPSTPHDPSAAVARGVDGVAVTVLAHGTTVATNALLEGNLAPVTLVTNEGLEDVIEIARQNRPSLYDQFADRPPPIVPRDQRIGIGGRLAADGSELAPVGDVPQLDGGRAVAVCLLHADLDPCQEEAVATTLRARGHDVTASHEISPEMREYERTLTTVINAALRPVCHDYLAGLAGLAPEVLVMTSAGGLIDLDRAADHPARLLLSGPAAGVRAAAAVAAANGFTRAVSFDMGGTSTDVCLIDGGLPEPAASLVVGGYPVRLPALAIHTVGAGGGSIAEVDDGGAVTVGPRSAGAAPGPACYRHGGEHATVTDADVLLDRIPAGAELPGIGHLDRDAAAAALERAGVSAADVVAVVDAGMTEAVRVVTVSQGIDPRDCALVAFGGAGPLHACAIADALDMPAVVVPARAGVFSAVGLVGAPVQLDLVRSVTAGDDLPRVVEELRQTAQAQLPGGAHSTAYDCRYAGQSHELRVAEVGAFHAAHEQRNGYRLDGVAVEVVAVRVRAELGSAVDTASFTPPARAEVDGPAVVAEPDCTIWVPDGWHGEVGADGALVLRRGGGSA
jgi:N-methylhydantoinase A/oxoprolinase/acetone carboxylase beta subunit